MGKWFPVIYDPLMAPLERFTFKEIRKQMIGEAQGRVLEIGSGTGVNFPFYQKASYVTAIEPNPEMVKRSLPKINECNMKIEVSVGDAENLDFQKDTFDTVVGTLVFCSIPNPERALGEIHRVLKPGGQLLLFEHVRFVDHKVIGKVQDLLTPVWKRVCDGCCLNRNTLQLVKDAGFQTEQVEFFYKGLLISAAFRNA